MHLAPEEVLKTDLEQAMYELLELFLAVHLTKRKAGKLAAQTLADVTLRADEPAEVVSLYFKETGRAPLT